MPFVVIQIIMVGAVIAFPQMVLHYKSSDSTLDPAKVNIQIPDAEPPAEESPGGEAGGATDLEKEFLKKP